MNKSKKSNQKKSLVLVSAIALVLVTALVTALIINAVNSHQEPVEPKGGEPDVTSSSTKVDPAEEEDDSDSNEVSDQGEVLSTKDASGDSKPDSSEVSSIEVSQLGIEVSYISGINGFNYEVMRTPSGTRYVEFRNDDVIGTKCSDDDGVFASIVEDPQSVEDATLVKTIAVEGTVYGLSIAESTCTSDPELLKSYQDSFTKAFVLLAKI